MVRIGVHISFFPLILLFIFFFDLCESINKLKEKKIFFSRNNINILILIYKEEILILNIK